MAFGKPATGTIGSAARRNCWEMGTPAGCRQGSHRRAMACAAQGHDLVAPDLAVGLVVLVGELDRCLDGF